MPLSTEVTLPKGVKPKFPEMCIVCHAVPDSTYSIRKKFSKVEFPICCGCKKKFKLQRWGRELVSLVLILLAVWLVMPYFSEWSKLSKKLAVGGLVVLAISPLIVFEVMWPRIFDITAKRGKVDYEFADVTYAMEFHSLNEPHVIKSDLEDLYFE